MPAHPTDCGLGPPNRLSALELAEQVLRRRRAPGVGDDLRQLGGLDRLEPHEGGLAAGGDRLSVVEQRWILPCWSGRQSRSRRQVAMCRTWPWSRPTSGPRWALVT
jgi:hypothetical protein